MVKRYLGHANKDGLTFIEEENGTNEQRKLLWKLTNHARGNPNKDIDNDIIFKTELEEDDAYSIRGLIMVDPISALILLKDTAKNLDISTHLSNLETEKARWYKITEQIP